ncbi:hypothetical protein D3C72_2491130 [compost metagenome]
MGWELGPKGSRGGLVSGTNETSWHSVGIEVSPTYRGTLKIRVEFQSREARTRRSTETIKIRLQADNATAQS